MPKNLIVVESPAKIRTIREIVGRKFDICATVGHFKDMPSNTLGVDVEHDFRVTYVPAKGKAKTISELKAAISHADRVCIATDPDREGEAIAWHVSQLVPAETPIERITFNAITRSEIEQALRSPTQINQNLVDSQTARRVIDRLIGYILSPEARRHFGEQISVGRVQSPAVALVVEREREIRAFIPEAYWLVRSVYKHQNIEFTTALKSGRVKDEDEANRLVEAIRAAQTHVVSDVVHDELLKNPPPPFITSTFQRAAFKAFHMGSKRAMSIAQNLYQGVEVSGKHVALITYMRTDSPRISNEGMAAAKEQIDLQFGTEFYQRRVFRGKAGSQDAHEAIRPAHPEITPEMAKQYLEKPMFQIYDLIYKRWLASQMKPAVYRRVKAVVSADAVELEAVGTTLAFEGFLKAYGADLNEQEKEDEAGDKRLPVLKTGDKPAFVAAENEKKTTMPPPRYNNGSLVEKLENLGIGRPSTYASIVELIQDRNYVEEASKRREFAPTALGEKLYDYLKQFRAIIVDYQFTARLEEEFDEVEEGKKPYLDVVREEFERVKDAYELYKKSGGFAMNHKPTMKQLQLAERLAVVAKEAIPDETLQDSKKLSEWIDTIKARADLPTLPPSEKQLKYAESLARDTSMELTEELKGDASLLSKFIDQARKILDLKIASNSREFAINYMSDEGVELEYEKTQVVDVIDVAEKKAIGLRFNPRVTKWIPRSQIVRVTDMVMTLKNKWAAETVYGGAAKAAQGGGKFGRGSWRRGFKKKAKT